MDIGSLRHRVLELADRLSVDDSSREVCPQCGGGSTKERSLAITRRIAAILYKCHRASCGLGGVVWGSAPPPKSVSTGTTARSRCYSGNILPLDSQVYQEALAKYGMGIDVFMEQGVAIAADWGRLRFPIYDFRGYTIGESLKLINPSKSSNPKTLTFKFSDVPLLHFPLFSGKRLVEKRLVLVEDQISAIKLSPIVEVAALLGTNLSDDGLTLLRRYFGDHSIIIMLDGDKAGRMESAKLQWKLAPFFDVCIVYLGDDNDPKDLTTEQLLSRVSLSCKLHEEY